MGVWERDYMREREQQRYREWLKSPPPGKSRTPADPPWLRIIVWLCIAAMLTAWGVREYERRHPKPTKRVIRSPKIAEPKQEDEKPAKPIDFFRQAPR
ncbi:MAG: hypothetical protein ACOZJX_08180 [Pseudomonadota bacterium]